MIQMFVLAVIQREKKKKMLIMQPMVPCRFHLGFPYLGSLLRLTSILHVSSSRWNHAMIPKCFLDATKQKARNKGKKRRKWIKTERAGEGLKPQFLFFPFPRAFSLPLTKPSHLSHPAQQGSSSTTKSLKRNTLATSNFKSMSKMPQALSAAVMANQPAAQTTPAAKPTHTCFGV